MIEMFKNSRFAPTADLNEILKKTEGKQKSVGKTYDAKALRKEIVDSYKKILAEARKKF